MDTAVARELEEETGAVIRDFRQVHTFGQPGRDPRGRAISIAYLTVIDKGDIQLQAATDAKDVRWFFLDSLPKLAFDHAEILAKAQGMLSSL